MYQATTHDMLPNHQEYQPQKNCACLRNVIVNTHATARAITFVQAVNRGLAKLKSKLEFLMVLYSIICQTCRSVFLNDRN